MHLDDDSKPTNDDMTDIIASHTMSITTEIRFYTIAGWATQAQYDAYCRKVGLPTKRLSGTAEKVTLADGVVTGQKTVTISSSPSTRRKGQIQQGINPSHFAR